MGVRFGVMSTPKGVLGRCGLCGGETACRLELLGRLWPVCPECTIVVLEESEEGSLARDFVLQAGNREEVH